MTAAIWWGVSVVGYIIIGLGAARLYFATVDDTNDHDALFGATMMFFFWPAMIVFGIAMGIFLLFRRIVAPEIGRRERDQAQAFKLMQEAEESEQAVSILKSEGLPVDSLATAMMRRKAMELDPRIRRRDNGKRVYYELGSQYGWDSVYRYWNTSEESVGK